MDLEALWDQYGPALMSMARQFTPSGQMETLKPILEILERPQQALFQGVNAATLARENNESQVDAALRGAWEGLSGYGDKVSGADLIDWGVENPYLKTAAGTALELTADPTQVVPWGTIGKGLEYAANVPRALETWTNLSKMRDFMPGNLSRLTSIIDDMPWLEKYFGDTAIKKNPWTKGGDHYTVVTDGVTDIRQALSPEKTFGNVKGFVAKDPEASITLLDQGRDDFATAFKHEGGHSVIDELRKRFPDVDEALSPLAGTTAGKRIGEIPAYATKSPEALGEEVFVRYFHNNFDRAFPNISPMLDSVKNVWQRRFKPALAGIEAWAPQRFADSFNTAGNALKGTQSMMNPWLSVLDYLEG